MAELKKCPFCGGEAKIASRSLIDGIHSIESITCKHCHVTIDRIWCQNTPYQTEVNVLEAWNNRATESEIRESVIDEFAEELEAELLDAKRVLSERREMQERESEMAKMCSYNIGVLNAVGSMVGEIAEQLKERQ